MKRFLKPSLSAISIGALNYNENWKCQMLFGFGSKDENLSDIHTWGNGKY